MTSMAPPTYESGRRSLSFQNINSLNYDQDGNSSNQFDESIVNNFNLNINKNGRVNVETNVNNAHHRKLAPRPMRLIPSISVNSDISSNINYNQENNLN